MDKTEKIYYKLCVDGTITELITTCETVEDFAEEYLADRIYTVKIGKNHYLIMAEENNGIYDRSFREGKRNKALEKYLENSDFCGDAYWIASEFDSENLDRKSVV